MLRIGTVAPKALTVSKGMGLSAESYLLQLLCLHIYAANCSAVTKRFVHTAHKYTFQARLLQQHGLPLSVAAVCLLNLNWIPVAFENTKCTVTITMQVLIFVPCTLRQISLEASITANAASGGTSMIPQCSTSSQCCCHADQACTIMAMS